MLKKLTLFVAILTIFAACNTIEESNTKIKVGVFNKSSCPHCVIDALEALKIDKGIEARIISASDIMLGKTNDIDVYLFPGGSGRTETKSLGEHGQQRIIKSVKKQGKGVIGICAGAYILTDTPDYPSLALSAAEAIDIEHDHRGHGIVKFSLTEEGKKIFPELANREISFSQYYEGPVLIPAKKSRYKYTELAIMKSDVHTVKGSPAGMTMNRPFIIISDIDNGKTASVVGHPECTPGMRWIIPRLARIVSNNEIIEYPDHIVKPDVYTDEILFTTELLEKQDEAFDKLYKSKAEKLEGMQELVDMGAWSAKKRIPEMLRDNNFEVRLLAAKLCVELERTDAIPDLEAAIQVDLNDKNKALLQEQLRMLKRFLPN